MLLFIPLTTKDTKNMLGFLLLLFIVVTVAANPASRPHRSNVRSATSCNGNGICGEGDGRFVCRDKGLVCCSGPGEGAHQIFRLRDGFECCVGSGKTYHIQNEICISGEIRKRTSSDERNCGTEESYNQSTQVCCENKSYDMRPGGECCGSEYLTDPHIRCCNGEKYKISEQTCCPVINGVETIYALTDISYGQCCVDVAYDPLRQSCVEHDTGISVENVASTTGIETCGRNLEYNSASHGCCISDTAQVYELRTRICHRGQLYDKDDPSQNDVCVIRSPGDPDHITLYQRDERTVCTNAGVVTLGADEEVCGDRDVYNTSTDLCCGGKHYAGLKLSEHSCCEGGGTEYFRPKTQSCCMNVVSGNVAHDDGSMCCFQTAYNPDTHMCGSHLTVVKKECPSLGDRCNVTVAKIKTMKRKKLFVYTGIVIKKNEKSRQTSKRSRNKKSKGTSEEWTMDDVKEFKARGGKVSLVPIKGKGPVKIHTTKCGCAGALKPDTQFIFVGKRGIKKGKMTLEKDYFIIPTSETREIGLLFKGLAE